MGHTYYWADCPAETVEQICNIAISPRVMQDRLIWVATTTGMFTVKNAYHLKLELRARNYGSYSVTSSNTRVWQNIWQLKIPRTVQLFLWRACNGIFPTKEKLCKRRVVDDPHCLLCGQEVESSSHAIWSCGASQAVWTECPNRISKCNLTDVDFLSLFGKLVTRQETEELELVAMVAQQI